MAAPTGAVIRLDDRQQRLAYIGAAVAAVGFVAGRVPSMPSTTAFVASGIGVAMAVLLFLAARRRSVVMTGAAAFLISFGPWTPTTWLLGAFYIAGGGVLMFRASKAAAATRPPREPRPSKRRQRRVVEAEAKPKRPERSKRYTPPKR
ncbi:MAG: hypothetical protein KY434_11335 [Actinobacteria bacterium]|nr:hypothetical protein [Actinomycetota bacterium]